MQRTRVNHMIRISPIRLIGAEGEQVGVVDTREAMQMAQEAGLDLVEIVPDTRPPVCKIMDYGKYKYEQSKRKDNKTTGQQEIKEVRLGRSVKIDPHDVQIRVNQARRFLMQGHKVQITQRFRGREMVHKELGIERLAEIVDQLADIAKVEMAPRWVMRQASIVLAPDKNKVEAAKRQKAKDEAAEAKSDAELDAQIAKLDAADTGVDDDDDVETTSESEDDKKAKPTRKVSNPVEDEISALLGE
ncbi:MAG: translation initiation factor IF-3 [Phycisphaera sp.]|nr:MAG: translation initiation factor IF-3 [Phycisphaera sp.]